MIIDLRSDTVTKPSQEMLVTMFNTSVGDDVFKEDKSVNELERMAAEMFGMQAALFCPSGTMTNQIAIKAQTQPGDEVICDENAHVHYYEGGGIAFNSGASTRTLKGDRGVFTAEQLIEAIRPSNVHFPRPSLVCIENSCNRGGGRIFPLEEIQRISQVCKENSLKLHLDGARLFNALIASGEDPKEFGQIFDSISICLSKGLGAPVGSLLIGSNELISRGLRIRKVLGGGMRQAGFMAAAGSFALQHHVDRLQMDHDLAISIERILAESEFVDEVLPVETNIIVFEIKAHVITKHFLAFLASHNIHAFEVGDHRIRFVTHLDLPPNTVECIQNALNGYSKSL
jgi:threonine aldolase